MDIILISGTDAKESAKNLKAAILTIQKSGKKLDEQIHVAAVSCIKHAESYGDVTLMTRLAHALPKHSRRKALIYWFSKFSPVAYSEKENQFKIAKGKDVVPYDVEGASNTPFWDFTPEKNVEPFTVAALLKYVERKFVKAKEAGELKETDLVTFKTEVQALTV